MISPTFIWTIFENYVQRVEVKTSNDLAELGIGYILLSYNIVNYYFITLYGMGQGLLVDYHLEGSTEHKIELRKWGNLNLMFPDFMNIT